MPLGNAAKAAARTGGLDGLAGADRLLLRELGVAREGLRGRRVLLILVVDQAERAEARRCRRRVVCGLAGARPCGGGQRAVNRLGGRLKWCRVLPLGAREGPV